MVLRDEHNARHSENNSQFCIFPQRKCTGCNTVLIIPINIPDTHLSFLIKGQQMIQQYARWIVLSWALTFRLVCLPLKKLYPDLKSLQNLGKI